MPQKIWFVTGASKGFGRIWAEAALARGDKVAATARNLADITPLCDTYGDLVLPLTLDVTRRADVFAAMDQARAYFGGIDVVIANAGYGQFGALEELDERAVRGQIETNLFGAIWTLQAALPIMRGQGSGHLFTVSSIGGLVSFPTVGIYNASKFAVEGLNEALAQEVEALGIKVTLIEPAGYATDWGGASSFTAKANPAYDQARDRVAAAFVGAKHGDPHHTADAVLSAVDAAEPPLRLLLGSFAGPLVRGRYERKLAEWDAWAAVSNGAD